jgi:hypothetical protein
MGNREIQDIAKKHKLFNSIRKMNLLVESNIISILLSNTEPYENDLIKFKKKSSIIKLEIKEKQLSQQTSSEQIPQQKQKNK